MRQGEGLKLSQHHVRLSITEEGEGLKLSQHQVRLFITEGRRGTKVETTSGKVIYN